MKVNVSPFISRDILYSDILEKLEARKIEKNLTNELH